MSILIIWFSLHQQSIWFLILNFCFRVLLCILALFPSVMFCSFMRFNFCCCSPSYPGWVEYPVVNIRGVLLFKYEYTYTNELLSSVSHFCIRVALIKIGFVVVVVIASAVVCIIVVIFFLLLIRWKNI